MFGLMKKARGVGGDMRCVKGSVLGTTQAMSRDTIDATTTALVQLCTYAMPQISGGVMSAMERELRIEPSRKPALRKFITDSYSNQMPLSPILRAYRKAARPRHDERYRLIQRLCQITRAADNVDSRSIGRIITAAKDVGLSKDEIFALMQKTGLAG